MPSQTPAKSGSQERPIHLRLCWSKVRWNGICEECYYQPPERMSRHGGVCERCGGQMRCRNTYLMGNGRCRMHGGQNVRQLGPGQPAYVHGRYSKRGIPADLAQRLYEAERDEQVLDLTPEVAYCEERIGQLLETIGDIGQPESWRQVQQLARDGLASESVQQAHDAFRLILGLARDGEIVTRNHREIDRLADRKRRLAESQRKAQLEAGEMIRLGQAIVLMDRLMTAVTGQIKRIDDGDVTAAEVLTAVWSEFHRIVGEPDQRAVEGGGAGSTGQPVGGATGE